MLCTTCKMDIPSTFKHAISKNECPSCGAILIDEEMMALIEKVGKTISAEATIREETVKKLATAIVTQYNISLIDDVAPVKKQVKAEKVVEEIEKPVEHKIAPPSAIKQVEQDIVNIPSISNEIDEAERDRIMEEAVKERYNLVDGSVDPDNTVTDITKISKELFGSSEDVLEKERKIRLSKHKKALASGEGFVRRRSQ